jgi:hypothetical protein
MRRARPGETLSGSIAREKGNQKFVSFSVRKPRAGAVADQAEDDVQTGNLGQLGVSILEEDGDLRPL